MALETEAIAAAAKRLRALFDLAPLIDQVSESSIDLALALEERRVLDLRIAAARLHASAGHLVRAIEQRRPRKGGRS